MTIEELKNKYDIIEDIVEETYNESSSYKVTFVMGGVKYFDNMTLDNIDEYCSRIENILKNL